MQDAFIEYMVKRKTTPKIIMAKIGIVVGTLLLWALIVIFLGSGKFSFIGLIAAFGSLYGGVYLITSMNVEFEYVVTNGDIDIDKIIARRKRRRLVTVNCREAEAFGRYKASEHATKSYQTKIFACESLDSEGLWYCAVRLKDKGLTLVVFNANEKMLEAIKPFLPRPVLREAFGMGAV